MEVQTHLPLEITDDDIQKAVKRFANTFTLLKAKNKFMKLQKAAAARREAEAAAGVTTVSPVSSDRQTSKDSKSTAKSPPRRGSIFAAARFVKSRATDKESYDQATPANARV